MKLIRKYHIVPYEDGSAVESAKRFLETILNDPTLETSEKCRFYQDLLYRIRQHRELPIMTDEVFDDLRDTYSQQNSNNEASAGAVAVPTLKRELAVVVPKIEKLEPEEPMDEDDDDLKELPAVLKRVKTDSADNAYQQQQQQQQQQQPTVRRLSRKRLHVDDGVEDGGSFETMKQRRVAAATLELPSPPVRTSRKRKILDNVKKQKLNIVQPTRPSPPPLLPPPPPTNQRRPPKRRHPILHSKIPEKRRKFVELFDPTGGKLPVWRVRKDYRFAPYQTERPKKEWTGRRHVAKMKNGKLAAAVKREKIKKQEEEEEEEEKKNVKPKVEIKKETRSDSDDDDDDDDKKLNLVLKQEEKEESDSEDDAKPDVSWRRGIKRPHVGDDDEFWPERKKRRTIRGAGPAAPAGGRIYCRLWKF
ncbi:hypothetical protein CRE_20507 [Caenorhabditis remanei]|uniref:Uncharacterized protein n=1 Tax=Caenorhabditis remanei TaxID=31234 RepID=E3N8C0_CAERE|nr:hypothetical protein CRE_20507 [Caenorhabditis remanei]